MLGPFKLLLISPSLDPNGRNRFVKETGSLLRSRMDIAANPVLKAFLAGTVSGTCSTVLFQPLDLVKTRIQNRPLATDGNGMFRVAHHVLRTEQLWGLWKGMVPSMAKTVPGVALYFSSLHWLKSKVNDGKEPAGPAQAIALGMLARCLAGCAVIPVTVLKTRFESGAFDYQQGMLRALCDIRAKEGLRGLCSGLVPTLMRDAPFSGLYLMFYTQLKQLTGHVLAPIMNDEHSTAIHLPTVHFTCGILAGFLASSVTHPADVVKTKMQLYPANYPSVRVTVAHILRRHGPKGFLAGLAPRMLRRSLMSAFAWTVYEQLTRKLGLK